ncbi:MAG: YceI family protein [Flavobacteriaceae bacterium]
MKIALNIILTMLLGWNVFIQTGERFKTDKGEININASTPLEDINALNSTVNAILDPATGNFAVVMLVKEFEFDRKLMQEHFNENYMESERYPKATFSGSIQEFEISNLKSSPSKFRINGKISIHGVTRSLNADIQISKTKEGITLSSNFLIRPEDHGIEVPKIVFQKIAQEVEISVKFDLLPP